MTDWRAMPASGRRVRHPPATAMSGWDVALAWGPLALTGLLGAGAALLSRHGRNARGRRAPTAAGIFAMVDGLESSLARARAGGVLTAAPGLLAAAVALCSSYLS